MKYNLKKIEDAGYRIMIDGEIISTKYNWRGYGPIALTQFRDTRGYLRVSLTIDNAQKQYPIHRLIAAKFLPKQPSKAHQIRHLDGNIDNNDPSNLKWGTSKENAADRTRHGRCTAAANGKRSGWKKIGKGIGVQKMGKLWRARITRNGFVYSLGYFDTKAEARRAYKEAAEDYRYDQPR